MKKNMRIFIMVLIISFSQLLNANAVDIKTKNQCIPKTITQNAMWSQNIFKAIGTYPYNAFGLHSISNENEPILLAVDGDLYNVDFNGNGNTGGGVPFFLEPLVGGDPVTLPDNTYNLVKTGYELTGWNTSPNGDGTHYDLGETIDSLQESLYLYAEWTAKSDILVSFDLNGFAGTVPSSIYVTFDAAYGTLPSLTRTGYIFDGWFTAASGGTEVTSATIVANEDPHTLYAQWTAKSGILVSFDLNGFTGTVPGSISVTFDAAYGTLPSLTRTGYIFDGWFTAS
ncbi:MAG: InlB B-repeat-containing protein, partial [Oscillospiraceae bacterium]|nr:InlB B-repeat-containing protein [Oscillospiraceae bacterium]